MIRKLVQVLVLSGLAACKLGPAAQAGPEPAVQVPTTQAPTTRAPALPAAVQPAPEQPPPGPATAQEPARLPELETGVWWYVLEDRGQKLGYKRFEVTRTGDETRLYVHTRQYRPHGELIALDTWISFGPNLALLGYTTVGANETTATRISARVVNGVLRTQEGDTVKEIPVTADMIPSAAETQVARRVPRRAGARLPARSIHETNMEAGEAGEYVCIGRHNLDVQVEGTYTGQPPPWLVLRVIGDSVRAFYWVDDLGQLVAASERLAVTRLASQEEALANLPEPIVSPYVVPEPGILRELAEIQISVSDLEQAETYYRGVLGLKPLADSGASRPLLDAGGQTIALQRSEEAPGRTPRARFAFLVRDLAVTVQALRLRGAKFRQAPPEGAVPAHGAEAIFVDPWENEWVLIQR